MILLSLLLPYLPQMWPLTDHLCFLCLVTACYRNPMMHFFFFTWCAYLAPAKVMLLWFYCHYYCHWAADMAFDSPYVIVFFMFSYTMLQKPGHAFFKNQVCAFGSCESDAFVMLLSLLPPLGSWHGLWLMKLELVLGDVGFTYTAWVSAYTKQGCGCQQSLSAS